jgi:membrane protease YdiL (CAAX protease family)
MAIGWLFHLDANSYLLVGVPLVVAFQIFVRKKPLASLWVRDAVYFKLDRWGIVLAITIAALPTIQLIQSFKSSALSSHLPVKLWMLCCIGGAFGAAFSLRHFTRETWKSLLFCLATAGLIGCGMMISSALLQKHSIIPTHKKALGGLNDFALYFAVCFVLEEVVFRGAIDSHIHQSSDKHKWLSAIFVSILWGLWHLPTLRLNDVLEHFK